MKRNNKDVVRRGLVKLCGHPPLTPESFYFHPKAPWRGKTPTQGISFGKPEACPYDHWDGLRRAHIGWYCEWCGLAHCWYCKQEGHV